MDHRREGNHQHAAPGSWTCIVVGAGSMALECVRMLADRGHRVAMIATDDPDLRAWAEDHGTPAPTVDDAHANAEGTPPVDYLFSIANLRLLGPELLRLAERAAINFHDGPLPDYAGRNVPSWAILAGERRHAVTWHAMTDRVDAGAVFHAEPVGVDPGDTAESLNAKCFEAGLRSFATLLDGLERGTATPAPQPDRPRRVFRGSDRPSAGGLLDPARPARALQALVRALDFGRVDNPLALPALRANGRTLLVRSATVDASAGDAAVGKVLAIDDAIRIRTAEGDLAVRDFVRADGRALDAAEAAEELGLLLGDVVPALDPSVVRDFERVARRWLPHEDRWVRRLRDATPLRADHLTDGHGPPGEEPPRPRTTSLQEAPPLPADRDGHAADRLLAATMLLFARLERADRIDVAYRHAASAREAGAAAHRFAPYLPLTIDLSGDGSFAAFARRVVEEARSVTRMGGFLRDLPLRRQALREVDCGWLSDSGTVAFERVPSADAGDSTARPGPDGPVGASDSAFGSASDAGPDDAGGAALVVRVPDDGGSLIWSFDPDRIDRRDVGRMQDRLRALCADLAAGVSVRDATVLAEPDRQALRAVNATATERTGPDTIHEAIAARADAHPAATALIDGADTWTYERLHARAERLAHRLVREGAGPGRRVGIMTDRSVGMVVALLAVLRSGAAYVPLDPSFPTERTAFMARDADLTLVLADEAHAAAVEGLAQRVLVLDRTGGVAGAEPQPDPGTAPEAEPERPAGADDLAYLIYTSGSTGRPKGVMLRHRNVMNFFLAMDRRLDPDPEDPGVWLAVTSMSFDISVLELLWTLARGFTVVLYDGADRRRPGAADRDDGQAAPVDLSLFYFSADQDDQRDRTYRLLLEGARFADRHGFAAVWTPERHFHAFGGPYPNPAVTGAAVAAVTERVRVRAGSCVLPLHHPVRVVEEWAVVDALSGGRVDVSFASGWQPNDFLLAPDAHADRKRIMFDGIDTVRALWRGEARTFDGPDGRPVEVRTMPRPVQPELPVWVTAAGNPDTFRQAGEIGAGVLTHMLGQDLEALAEKVRAYRAGWAASGRPGRGHVSLMMHAHVGDDPERVREPLREYLRTSAFLTMQFASSFPAFRGVDPSDRSALDDRFRSLDDDDVEALLDHAFERYYATRGLFGPVEECVERVERVVAADVDEIACLIDFGLPADEVLAALPGLARLREALARRSAAEAPTIPELIRRHGVTHLQCTPSMAQMLVADGGGRDALSQLHGLLVGGEALPRALARTLTSLGIQDVRNMYGPTETTIWSTVQSLAPDAMIDADGPVPIGTPVANTRVYVCDPRGRPLPPGVAGELVIGGDGVAAGYWRRREATEERFLPDRISGGIGLPPVQRLYRTGDLVRLEPGGVLSYLGRSDFQVKVRGHRIELEEIEAVLDEHAAVRRSVVVVRPGQGGDARLVAYAQSTNGAAVRADDVRAHLRRRLPEVMVPDVIVPVRAFPLTPNGKVDRRALPEPVPEQVGGEGGDGGNDTAAPPDDLEQLILSVWRRALGVRHLSVHDDFFDRGGNSLLAVFVTGEIAERGHPATLADLMRAPTVAGLARRVRSRAGEDEVARSAAPVSAAPAEGPGGP